MSKYLPIILGLLFLSLSLFMFRSAQRAKRKSEDIQAKFKEVNELLSNSRDSMTTKTNTVINDSDIQNNYLVASAATTLILFIDSLDALVSIETSNPKHEITNDHTDRLKSLILDFNAAVINGRKSNDTIYLGPVENDKISKKWDSHFFRESTKSQTHAYLTLLKNKVLEIQATN